MQVEIPPGFTLDELMGFLEKSEEAGDAGFLTRKELQEHTGLSKDKAYELLHAAQKQGRLEHRTVYRLTLAGHMFPRPGYRFIQQTEPEGEDRGQEE